MKKQYVVTTYVEANSAQEALKKASTQKPHEAYIHNQWWEKRDFTLNEVKKPIVGFGVDKKK